MLSIGEFSKISKVTTKTLRYYDEIGLLKPLHVNKENGYRFYNVTQLKTILLINRLKRYLFTLEEIAGVLASPQNDSLLFFLIQQKRRAIRDKVEEYGFILSQMESDAHNLERGIDIMAYLDDIPVKLVETQPKNILSFRKKINVAEYGQYLGRLYQTIVEQKLTPLGPPMSIYHDEMHDPENYDMEIAIPIKEAIKGTREFPGGLCAMATLHGPYTELPSVYAKMQSWMEAEGYAPAGPGMVAYEVYLTDPHETPPEENRTEVYLHVKK